MSSDLYSPRILELAADIPVTGAPSEMPFRAHKVSRLCGSEVTLGLSLADGVIDRFAMDAHACALGQASACILARGALGARPDEVRAARDSLAAMLRAGGPAPQGRFWELRHLEPVRDYPPRHVSTLLAFEAAVAALDAAGAASAAATDLPARQLEQHPEPPPPLPGAGAP
jgi:NifU-like protein involved in Fe-S cluster formation